MCFTVVTLKRKILKQRKMVVMYRGTHKIINFRSEFWLSVLQQIAKLLETHWNFCKIGAEVPTPQSDPIQ